MKTLRLIAALVMTATAFLAGGSIPAMADTARITDVASLQAGRDNQLIDYGLVVGPQGTGDSLGSSPFTPHSMRAMLQKPGLSTQAPRTPEERNEGNECG